MKKAGRVGLLAFFQHLRETLVKVNGLAVCELSDLMFKFFNPETQFEVLLGKSVHFLFAFVRLPDK